MFRHAFWSELLPTELHGPGTTALVRPKPPKPSSSSLRALFELSDPKPAARARPGEGDRARPEAPGAHPAQVGAP